MNKDPLKLRRKKWVPSTYLTYYGKLKSIANKYGWCLSVHGSMRRDFDILLTPWAEEVSHYMVVLKEFYRYVWGRDLQEKYWSKTKKPHGRMSYTISSGAGTYFDISIIPARKYIKK